MKVQKSNDISLFFRLDTDDDDKRTPMEESSVSVMHITKRQSLMNSEILNRPET